SNWIADCGPCGCAWMWLHKYEFHRTSTTRQPGEWIRPQGWLRATRRNAPLVTREPGDRIEKPSQRVSFKIQAALLGRFSGSAARLHCAFEIQVADQAQERVRVQAENFSGLDVVAVGALQSLDDDLPLAVFDGAEKS